MSAKLIKCSQCGKEISLKEIKRQYGQLSDIYSLRLCSAKCYTERQFKNLEKTKQ